jgi:enediyne biosynthesis protein E4
MKTKLVFLTVAMMAAVNTGFSQAVAFTQITNGAIATDLGTYTRSAWGDFNNDGYLDLFVSNWDHRTNVFYWNNGDGTFTKLTQGDPVQDADYHTGAAAADFDNDGYLDLLVSTGGPSAASRNLLYHNNGDGTFSRVSGGIVTNQLGFFNACTWADYDNDGYVDLFITDTGDASNDGGKSLLFHNNGNGTFTKVTSGAVVNDISVGNGALWADYDNDGFMDLIVINIANNGHNFLYHNNRNGTFTRILTNAIVTDSWPAGAEGAAWGDYDNDGLLDLFVTDNNGTRNRLYHNNGNGAFTNVSSGPMLVPRTGFASGAAWGDYDNDGYLDLFVAYYGATNALYHNNGDGTFTQILIGAPVDNNGSGIYSDAPTWVDYDNDGFLDLFVTRHSFNGIPISNLLYHSGGNTNGWLEVKCVGTVANRSAIGTKVRVRATIGGKTFWQLREIDNGGGWNVVPLVAHFGLGDATNVDTLRIEWPSGTVQEFQNVAAKQMLTITEPPSLLVAATNGVPLFSVKGGRGFQYEVDSSTDLRAWSSIGTLSITNLNGTSLIVDTNPPALDQRFYQAVSQ